MVTAEIAVALPALVLILSLMLGVAHAGAAKVLACDHARQAARAASIGAAVPVDDTEIGGDAHWVHASARVTLGPGNAAFLPAVTCEAVAWREVSP